MQDLLLISSRKGLVVYQLENATWVYKDTHFLGVPVTYTFVDEQTGVWWALLDHGHWGIKIHRSGNHGKTWTELEAPKYPENTLIREDQPASSQYLWSMAKGHKSDLWIGTIPGGLFQGDLDGQHWNLNLPLWNDAGRKEWFGAGFDEPGIHSIIMPSSRTEEIFIGVSCGGVYYSPDYGENWEVRNKGLRADFLPDQDATVGHDPHILKHSASDPNVFWQQNHCGIYVSNNSCETWDEVSDIDNGAYFGFCLAVDDTNPDVAWVIPAIKDEVRVAIDQSLFVSRTTDRGKTWTKLTHGLPQHSCFDIVYRHAFEKSGKHLVFGTTTGNLFHSDNMGDNWKTVSNFLPMVYAVSFSSI